MDIVLYFPQHGDYKPDRAYFNQHTRSSSGGPRTHPRTISRSTVPYIEDGAEMTHRTVSEHLQLVTQHALSGVRTTQTQNFGSDVPAESRTLTVPLFAPQIADVLPVDHDHDKTHVEIWLDKRNGETVWKHYI